MLAPTRASVGLALEPSQAPSLSPDTALLRTATQALHEDDAAEALRLVAEHSTRFPDSPLTDVRDALHIQALCRAGEVTQARAHARAFLDRRPQSPVAQRVRNTCAAQPPVAEVPVRSSP